MVLMGDPRLYSLWGKYLNFTSFCFSITYFATAIYACLRFLKEGLQYRILLALLAGIGGGIFFQIGTGLYTIATCIPALLGIAGAYAIGVFNHQSSAPVRERVGRAVQAMISQVRPAQLVLYAATLIPFALLMFFYYKGASNPYSSSGRVVLSNLFNAESLFGAFYPLIPLFVFSLVYSIIKRKPALIFMGMAAVVGCGLAYSLVIRGDNQYKFVHLSSILIMLAVIPVLYSLAFEVVSGTFRRNISRLLLAVIALHRFLGRDIFHLHHRDDPDGAFRMGSGPQTRHG